LLLAQPAINIPITDTDDIAEKNKTPILISHICNPFANISGAITTMAMIITIKGARLNKNLSAPSGVIPSFTISFSVSAAVWNIPTGPTRLGPSLNCIHAETFLSIMISTKPSNANKLIIHTPTITNSMSIGHGAAN
jgi:hypothetical protein